jgi:DIS3-like exonuclease 2
MQRAEYVISGDSEISDLRHSALNFDLYTHFTSPIRRYPDMIVHRQLKHVLAKLNNSEDYILSKYDRFVNNFNEKYINGKQISTKCQKLFHCLYLKNIPIQKYKALIIDICNKSNNKNKRSIVQVIQENALTVTLFIETLNLEIVIGFNFRIGKRKITIM